MKSAALCLSRRLAAGLLIWLPAAMAFPAGPAARSLPAENPEPVAAAQIMRVIDGDTVVLDTGAEVRLTGIQAPKLPLGRKGFRAWPLAQRAKEALQALSRGRRVTLEYPGRQVDRWGRLLAHVRHGDVWLQEEMLKRGLARVYTFADNRADAGSLYRAERQARKAKRGIWALGWYRIRAPAETERHIGSFQIVEGVPVDVAIVRGRGFINFGADWRSDFTIAVAPGNLKLFRRAGVNIGEMKNRRIRVRGWLQRRNGPMIAVTHPEQIEILAEQAEVPKK